LTRLQRIATPLTCFYCPTRRSAIAYPFVLTVINPPTKYVNVPQPPTMCGRSDYAGAGGDYLGLLAGSCAATTLAAGDAMSPSAWAAVTGGIGNGIFYIRSKIKMAEIIDGTSDTYLAGEKYHDPDHYHDGTAPFDDQGWDSGWDCDTIRWSGSASATNLDGTSDAAFLPRQDTPGDSTGSMIFGSAHAIGFNMAFCDGSVQFLNYSIDKDTHHRLGNRRDGQTIDAKAY